MGAAKLAIIPQYQKKDYPKNHHKRQDDIKGLAMFGADHLSPPAITGCIRDLIHFETIGKFAVVFFDRYIAKLLVDVKGIIFTGGYPKINHHHRGIAIDHEVSGVVSMEEPYPVAGTLIINVSPGKLAHVKVVLVEMIEITP
jgi:hypothetical protein